MNIQSKSKMRSLLKIKMKYLDSKADSNKKRQLSKENNHYINL